MIPLIGLGSGGRPAISVAEGAKGSTFLDEFKEWQTREGDDFTTR